EDGGDLLAALGAARDRRDRDQGGDVGAGVGDELLAAVDHPLVAVEHRGGPGAARVAARVRLGQAETGQGPAAGEFGQPALLLLLVAEAVDRHGAQRDPGLQGDRHTLVDLAQLLQRQAQGEVVAAHAAVLLREGQAEQTHLGHARHHLVGEGVRGVVLGRHRGHHRLREIPHGQREIAVLLRQGAGGQEVGHAESPSRSAGSDAAEPAGAGSAVPVSGSGAVTTRASNSSSRTWAPAATSTSTTPSTGAVSVCSIFMASTTTTGAPAATAVPEATGVASTEPGMGLRISASPTWAAAPRTDTSGTARSVRTPSGP